MLTSQQNESPNVDCPNCAHPFPNPGLEREPTLAEAEMDNEGCCSPDLHIALFCPNCRGSRRHGGSRK